MLDIKDLKVGARTEIFEDPMTELRTEGEVELVEDLGIMVPAADGQELHHWKVKFFDGPCETTERWLKVRKRKVR